MNPRRWIIISMRWCRSCGKFFSFKVTSCSATVSSSDVACSRRRPDGGETTIDLGKGHSLEVKLRKDKGDKVKAEVRWVRDGKAVVSTSVTMAHNQPVVLGGVKSDGGTLIVTLTAK